MNAKELQNTILAIITNNTRTYEHPSEYLHILDIRNRLAELDGINLTRNDVDAAFLALHRSGKAYLQIEEGFRFLAAHPEYTEAGVRVGGEVRHLVSLAR